MLQILEHSLKHITSTTNHDKFNEKNKKNKITLTQQKSVKYTHF